MPLFLMNMLSGCCGNLEWASLGKSGVEGSRYAQRNAGLEVRMEAAIDG